MRLKLAIVSTFWLIGFMLCLWLMFPSEIHPADYDRQTDCKYHGVSAMTESWSGVISAYKWNGDHYVLQWRAKRR